MNSKKNLKRNLLICLLAGSAVMYTLPLHAATSVIGNNTLPSGGQFVHGEGNIASSGLEMNITQNGQNAVIKWNDFSVGGNATVNFDYTGKDNFNTLNYVNSGKVSQIYGTINAQHEGYNGNIFIVNTAGVQIGPSAQINVGSLHVSNKYLNESELGDFAGKITPEMINTGKNADAVLMSLGNINAGEVTFEGNGRIVIDSERIKDEAGNDKLGYKNINITTSADNTDNIIIGYDGYDATIDKDTGKAIGYAGANGNTEKDRLVTINGNDYFTKADGYMWVEDVEQLQAINTNLSGNYALRNSIDATGTTNWSDPEVDGKNEGFLPIGIHNDGKVYETTVDGETKYGFYGNFDGVDYNIFGLTINREDTNNVGLFGVAHDANINNVTLVGGSITGGSVVGSVVGAALGNTHITNATNSASVTGNADVGGIVGYSGNKISDGDNGNINVSDTDSHFTNLINTGAVYSKGESDGKTDTISNTGGLIGYMYNGTLDGNSYNLGDVSGKGYNVGGLVGHAVNSTIGDGTNLVYNRLDVEGKYNVGGIVGNMDGTTVQNAENSGNITATGYTTEEYTYHTGETVSNNIPNGTLNGDGTVTTSVNVANVGGIAGTASNNSTIKDVTNSADVSSNTSTYTQNGKRNIYYTAGNVGGIVGRAENTDINNATNKENTIRGAHNVGGVAGYFGNTDDADKIYTVNTGINDGGDIMATGARNSNGFVKELVRPVGGSNESFIIGNIGGIVGYMDGDDVFVTASGNRGTVHSQDIAQEDAENVLDTSKAANVGGVVGKIDRSDTEDISTIKQDETKAAVSNSYNTGDVRGYTGVGGVVGMMYNGEVAGSYNLGNLRTTRIATNSVNIEAVNMGGIVGDTTEGSRSQGVVIYDVYNKGQIGDDTYTYYARHVAGIVGRLSGEVEKAYNNGEIYNGYTATGGVAGWMYEGSIKNAFNTGNITVYNHDSSTSQVGGIVGAAGVANGDINLTNVYNLGTLRSFKAVNDEAISGVSHNVGDNSVAGIIGAVLNNQHKLIINGAYTTGNIYAGIQQKDGSIIADGGYTVMDGTNIINNIHVGSIYSENRGEDNKQAQISLTNTYYIAPQKELQDNGYFQDLSEVYAGNGNNVPWIDKDNSNKAIDYVNRSDKDKYKYDNDTGKGSLNFSSQSGGNVTDDTDDNWRLYGDTPILNAFLPDSEKYFDQYGDDSTLKYAGMDKVQYGTAYDPLLTIVTANENANGNLSFNFGNGDNELSISNAAGLVVNGAGVTINNFTTSGGSGYFGGLLYSEGVLTINAAKGEGLGLGSASQIYGSSVTLTADGTITVYGDVVATGNETQTTDNPDEAGSINITSNKGDVNVYGTLTSAQDGENVVVPGISATADAGWKPADSVDKLNDPKAHLNTIGDRFEVNTVKSNVGGNINITANGVKNDNGELTSGGNVNLYYGNKQEGLITTGGDLTVTGEGDVYVDSDLDIGRDLTLKAGAGNEALLDITNIGQVQNDHDNEKAKETLHNFLDHFANGTGKYISFGNTTDAKITVDMWNGNTLNLDKFGNDFTGKLNALNIIESNGKKAQQLTHIWVNNGEQLKNIQTAAKSNADVLGYNFALKGDINASDVTDYEAIGGTTGFTGTFDGRGNRVIGLTVNNDNGNNANAGIFSTVGDGGVVKNVNIYSGNFNGTDTAGAVAGVNKGRIENVTGFGNTVEVIGAGIAGGIVGKNEGKGTFGIEDGASTLTGNGIYDVQSIGSVITASGVAGGLVGINDGALGNSYSDSAVTSTAGTSNGLGGVAGVNKGDVQYVDSLGVTNGGTTGSSNVGGVIGINNGNMYSGYNESIVSGKDNVGGIIGQNTGKYENDKWNGGTVENVVNATGVTGSSNYVGGLVGTNTGSVTNGRNNGTITGTNYVGGLVGNNADEHSILTNLVNDSSAEILGEQYVGGIAGTNAGTITAQNQANLINRGSITGQNYVGGVAGENIGTIEYVNNDVSLNVKDTTEKASYFGGVAGINGRVDDDPDDGVDNNKKGTITNATNEGNVIAPNADYVGGIVGHNTVNGVLDGMGNSNDGRVEGATYVGGVAGKNDAAITGAVNDMVGIENNGVVIAHKGGAGGIFGENTGDIKYAELTNNGIVSGTYSNNDVAGTGGIFGVNSGDITYSSLKNNIGGQVIGTQNVGGLIGINTGTITGGRIEADGTDADYYKYQIYNNGVINVGTWTDNADSTAEGYGKVDANEFKAAAGSNIGGLIGSNTDSLTAGYNTGAINASGSTNVGGIAGANSGTLDQVFNTVMTPNGEDTIIGGNNVGGLVGNNSGTLSNAYNTTEVKSTNSGVVGNAVGVNDGKDAKVNFVYDVTNTDKKLIGTNNGNVTGSYSGNEADGNVKGITYVAEGDRLKENTYQGSLNDANTWKFYDGNSNPLLKVFLTNLTVNETVKIDGEEVTLKDYLNLVYNGKEQDLNIADLIEKGFITAPNEELLNAYKNTLKDQSNGLGESYLLDNADGQKNAGDYQNDEWLYSNQIHSSTTGSFNPNNLGYDINFVDNDGSITVDKATINIDLNDIYHTYGDVDNVYSDKDRHNKTSYEDSYTISNWTELDEVLQDYIEKHLNVQFKEGSDGAVNGDKTQSVGDYNWSLDFTLGGTDASNYQIGEGSGNVNSVTITGTDKSHVEKAKLTININNVDMTYGDKETVISGQYGYAASTNVGENLVNGDSIKDVIAGMTYENTAYNADGTTKDVIDGKYALQDKDVTGGSKYGNYEITINDGKVTMGKAQLVVDINNVDMTYGDKESTISNQYGYTVNNGLVNGDSLKDVIADMGYNNTAYNTDGTTKGVIDGKYALQDKDVTGGSKYGNYEITINDGKVTMGKAQLVVDINNVDMTYGDKESTISNQYGYTVNNGLVNGDSLKDVIADMGYNNTAYNTDGTTKGVIDGKYALQDKDVTGGSKYGNYEITINDGKVTMGKAQLVVDINNVDMTYGDKESTISNQYGYTVNNGLVNGDSLKDVIADMGYNNTAYNTDGTTKDVIDGKYALENKDITVGGKYGNYEVTINDGTVMMNKADLNIKVDNANTTVGKMPGELTGTVEGLTNGDTLPAHDFALEDDSLISVSGNHKDVIGIVIGGKFYELGDADWSNGLFANYDVNYEMGDLAVSVVEIPDNWPNNRWDYLFGDNPFDRNENFRERKAEVNFVDGAMEI